MKKIPTSLYNDNFFCKRTHSEQTFCCFTVRIAHAVGLKTKRLEKKQNFTIPMKSIFKSDDKENCNF